MRYFKSHSQFLFLTQNKRSKDDGIDFLGYFEFPNELNKLQIVGQCKDEKKKCSSVKIREMAGVIGNQVKIHMYFLFIAIAFDW